MAILVDLFLLLIQLGILALLIVLVVLNRRQISQHYRAGLLVGFAIFVTVLPGTVFGLVHLDVSKLGPGLPTRFHAVILASASVVGLATLVLKIVWHMLVYCAAIGEWEHIRPDPFPLLQGRGAVPRAAMLLAVALGVLVAAISFAAFLLLDTQEGDVIKSLSRLFPGAADASLGIQVPVVLLTVTSVAIAEEIVFRGALLGFLLRVGRSGAFATIAAHVAVSLTWALLHVPNTDNPLAKCTQMFLIGILFCEFARRRGVECAIVAHVSLNVVATVLAVSTM